MFGAVVAFRVRPLAGHQLRNVHGMQRSKITSMISIHLQSCVPKIIKKSVHICKSYCEKISGTFIMWTRCLNTLPLPFRVENSLQRTPY